MNERLLRDGCEAVALVGGRSGEPSSQAVRLWLEFVATPTPSCWYRAHNASIVTGYLEHEGLAGEESAPEPPGLVRDGNPIYAWPYEQRHVWRTQHLPFPGRILQRITLAR